MRALLDVLVPMRDGTRLATDVYLPETGPGPWPALLLRTPYDKSHPDRVATLRRFAEAGYAAVGQDCRGRFRSGGTFTLGIGEAEDGYDTIEWIAAQPWCDGKVGTIGTSYMAWVQSAAATLNPPHLRAMWVHEGIANGLLESVRQGGAFELRWLAWAFYGLATDPSLDEATREAMAGIDFREWIGLKLPEPGASPLALTPHHETWYYTYLTRGTEGEPWTLRGLNVERYYREHADVPTVYSGGWYDSYTRATIRNFLGLSALKRAPQYLLMGPWTHGPKEPGLTYAGDVDFGSAAAVDYFELRRRWFDHHLKGRPDGDLPSRVRYFVMGGGSGRRRDDGRLDHGGWWADAPHWPPPGAGPFTFFLHPDGRLVPETPVDTGAADALRYTFDPRDPVPTVGGNISFLRYVAPLAPGVRRSPPVMDRLVDVSPVGGWDQRTWPGLFGARPPYGPLNRRPDVVSFVSAPLARPLLAVGPVTVRLFVVSDAPDTDFTAKLIDWYPPGPDYPLGYALNVGDGIGRLRFRHGFAEEARYEPNTVAELVIELYPTANLFAAGHRIRLDIASSNFPRFDINPNTGEPLGRSRRWRLADNGVVMAPAYPSALVLTVLEGS